MPEPSVSIILTVRNEAAHIARCLDSVLALDLAGIDREVLIVDGMSDDGTREAIARMQNAKRKTQNANCVQDIKLLDNPSRGVAAGRNIGIGNSNGGVLVMLDAHASYAPDYVRRCLEVMEKTGAANVGGPAIALPGGDGAMARAIALAHHSPFGLGGGQFRDPGAEGFVETLWPGCFRREVFARTGPIDQRRSRTEDLEFNTRLRAAGFTIYLSPLIKAWYYCRTKLGETWRQRWADGYEITRFLPDNPSAPKPRHYIPLVFVLGLLCSGGAALVLPASSNVSSLAAVLFLSIIAAYLAAIAYFVIQSALRGTYNGITMVTQSYDDSTTKVKQSYDNSGITMLRIVVLLPVVFATLHLSYGLGSLWGLICLPFVPHKNARDLLKL